MSGESTGDRLAEQIARSTQRLAQMKARQLLKLLRAEAQARSIVRRKEMQQRMISGAAVVSAGCSDLDAAEIVGSLLYVRERMDASATMRSTLRKRGQQHLDKSRASSPLDRPLDESRPDGP